MINISMYCGHFITMHTAHVASGYDLGLKNGILDF